MTAVSVPHKEPLPQPTILILITGIIAVLVLVVPVVTGAVIWRKKCSGAHGLCCNLTVVSQDESVHQRIFTERHLDGQAFLHHDNKKDVAESPGLGAEAILGPEMWRTETEDLRDTEKELRMSLADILALPRRGDLGLGDPRKQQLQGLQALPL